MLGCFKDLVLNFEDHLLTEGVIDQNTIDQMRSDIKLEINNHLQATFDEEVLTPNLTDELADVYKVNTSLSIAPSGQKKHIRFVDAVSDGLRQSMERYEDLVIMGQDIAEYGGVFKITEGFTEIFGTERVRNTPICESAVVSAAYGLSVNGMKAVMEMQFADFVSSGLILLSTYWQNLTIDGDSMPMW